MLVAIVQNVSVGWFFLPMMSGKKENIKKYIRWNNYQFLKLLHNPLHPIFHLCSTHFVLFVLHSVCGSRCSVCISNRTATSSMCLCLCLCLCMCMFVCVKVSLSKLQEFMFSAGFTIACVQIVWSVVFVIKRSFKHKMILRKHLLHSQNVSINYICA